MTEISAKKAGLQRVQIGLTGLVGVILLVGLANIVINRAQTNAAPADPALMGNAMNGNGAAGPADPLAQMGATPAVLDLQPDPQIRQRMDRDPRPERR